MNNEKAKPLTVIRNTGFAAVLMSVNVIAAVGPMGSPRPTEKQAITPPSIELKQEKTIYERH